MANKHIIIFSHGFGVRKDDLGLLTEIAGALPEVEPILFDYYEIDEVNKTLTIRPPSIQAEMLNDVILKSRNSNPDAIIDLIAHSQGCVITALAKPNGIRKTLLLAPVFDVSIERTLSRYRTNPETEINFEGISKLPVLDGLVRLVPAQYWSERRNIKTIDEYNALAEKTELIVIEANQDNLLPKVNLSTLSLNVKLSPIDGDHNFSGEARQNLLKTIRNLVL